MRIPDNFRHYLAAHKDCNQRHLVACRGLSAEDLEVSTDARAVQIKKMVAAVVAETHRMKAFVRLRPLGPGILCGYLNPRHRIGERICDHFARRNPGAVIILGNGRETWIGLDRDGKVWREHGAGMAETLDRMGLSLACGAECQDTERLWKAYYESQYVPERKNVSLFRRRMPERDLRSSGLRGLRDVDSTTLDDFSK